MKVVIDIDDELYKEYVYINLARGNGKGIVSNLLKAIKKGTPLPEHHGRLVDISKIDEDKVESDNPIIGLTINGQYTEAISIDYLNNLPTVIEGSDSE